MNYKKVAFTKLREKKIMNTIKDAIITVLVKHGGALTAEEVMDRMNIKSFYKASTRNRDVLEDLERHLKSL